MLVLGGEAPTADKIRRWHDKMFLINGYVLAETTIWCNARGRLKGNSDPANFGPPIGARVWVTDAGNRSVLLPVTATSAPFISPPEWITTAYPGKLTYGSGDIARCRPDGTYPFVHRRGNQVKVKSGIRHAFVLYPKKGTHQGHLTVVLLHHSLGGKELGPKQTSPGSGGIIAMQGNEAIWITVENLLYTVNSKMYCRQILTWLELLTDTDLASIVQRHFSTPGSAELLAKPKTKMEEHFVQIWSSALNLPLIQFPKTSPRELSQLNRFPTDGNELKQKISSDIAGSLSFQHHHYPNLAESFNGIDKLQASLKISQGPLLASCLLEFSDGQAHFFASHHLVIDLVSWRIILADLEKLLADTSGAASPPSLEHEGFSMPSWQILPPSR
ncbi:uncharacterized protein FPRN_15160 [Fusarium proliferatum]|nr:uncharacterized protein FPRN_15160 [Fusarium proliferatum]